MEKVLNADILISSLPSYKAQHKLASHFLKNKPTIQQVEAIVAALSRKRALCTQSSTDTDTAYEKGEKTTINLLFILSKSSPVPWTVFSFISLNSALALALAKNIFASSKQYLIIASSNIPKSSSFTPISSTIAQLHESVLHRVLKQLNKYTVEACEAIEALIRSSPWDSLDSSLRGIIYESSRIYLDSHTAPVLYLYSALSESGYKVDLLDNVIKRLNSAEPDVAIQESTESQVDKVKIHAYKALFHVQKPQTLLFWSDLIDSKLLTPITIPQIKAHTFDILSAIPDSVCSQLPAIRLNACICSMIGALSDEDEGVRSAAIGALGVYCTLSRTRSDNLFLSDLIHSIPSVLKTKSVLVRVRASWALANLCGALPVHDSSLFTEKELTSVYKNAVNCIKDSQDRVRANGVRAIGSFSAVKKVDLDCLAAILKCASTGAVKTRWNAFYALSAIVSSDSSVARIPALCETALESIKKCGNVKVVVAACGLIQVVLEAGGRVDVCVVARALCDSFEGSAGFKDRVVLETALRRTAACLDVSLLEESVLHVLRLK